MRGLQMNDFDFDKFVEQETQEQFEIGDTND